MTAPPAPAPDDLIVRLNLRAERIYDGYTPRSGNIFAAIAAELSEAAAALAARDAEIAAERKRADMLWQECENLRAALRELHAALEAIEMESRDGAQWGFAEINECARIALERK